MGLLERRGGEQKYETSGTLPPPPWNFLPILSPSPPPGVGPAPLWMPLLGVNRYIWVRGIKGDSKNGGGGRHYLVKREESYWFGKQLFHFFSLYVHQTFKQLLTFYYLSILFCKDTKVKFFKYIFLKNIEKVKYY